MTDKSHIMNLCLNKNLIIVTINLQVSLLTHNSLRLIVLINAVGLTLVWVRLSVREKLRVISEHFTSYILIWFLYSLLDVVDMMVVEIAN